MCCSSNDEIFKISVACLVVENVAEVRVLLSVCVSTGCVPLSSLKIKRIARFWATYKGSTKSKSN